MNNVHGIHDNPPESNRRMRQNNGRRQDNQANIDDAFNNDSFQGGISQQHLRNAQNYRVLFVSGKSVLKNPRDEHYGDMLMSTFCPIFTCLSLTVLLVLTDVGMFIAENSIGLNRSGEVLEVQSQTIIDLGGNFQPLVRKGQVWRLVSAIFLHVNFMHILGNVFSTFILVTRIQYTYGFWKSLFFYLLSGIGGNIFSLVINNSQNTVYAGASTALYGMLGLVFGYVFINWPGLEVIGNPLRCQLLCTLFMFLIFILIFTGVSGGVDYYGHLGGFLTGVELSSLHETIRSTNYQKISRSVFAICFLIQFTATFVVFYTRN